LYIACSAQVVVGAAVVGAVYAGVAYFQKDKDVADSIDRFGSNVKSDAKGVMLSATAASVKLLEQVSFQLTVCVSTWQNDQFCKEIGILKQWAFCRLQQGDAGSWP